MLGNKSKRRTSYSFRGSMGPVLVIGQCFGLLPITGILNGHFKFKWINIRTILGLVNIATGLFMGGVTLCTIIRDGINLRNMVGVIFFIGCSTVIILFLHLATKWRTIMQKWYTSEESFLRNEVYLQVGLLLHFKIFGVTMIVTILAVGTNFNATLQYNSNSRAFIVKLFHKTMIYQTDIYANRRYEINENIVIRRVRQRQLNKATNRDERVETQNDMDEPEYIIDVFNENRNLKSNDGDYFFRAMGPVLIIAQVFGIMPVVGVLGNNIEAIQFKWAKFRTIVTCCNIFSGLFFGSVLLRDVLKLGITAKNIVGVVFFSCCTLAFVLFLKMAQKWAKIMKHWTSLEKGFLKPPYGLNGWSVRTKIRLAAGFVLSTALVEHILYNVTKWYEMNFYTKSCNVIVDNWFKYFFENHFVFMFNVLPYNVIVSLYLEYSNFSLTVAWNYMDLFIMLISIGISTRFKQINHRLKMMSDKVLPEKLWEQIRCDYCQLCELVDFIDGHLAPIILLSCINNLYFICFQLLNIFNSLPHAINKLYFWFSLLYLIGRTTFVYLCAAEIHDASKIPLEIIRSIPSSGWCGELERFSDQVRSELIALSGSNFFFMTRKLLFGIAGTVVTYELVLLQFDEQDSMAGSGNSTNSSICDD